MPILNVDLASRTLMQICCHCGDIQVVALDDLILGRSIVANRTNPDEILLPACPCGTVEVLLRTWDTTPEDYHDSAHCEQRAAVNALAQHLRGLGQQHDLAKPIHEAETTDPPEIMPLDDAQNLRVPSHDRLEAHAAWNASVANRAKNPAITFGRRMGAKPAISPTPPKAVTKAPTPKKK